jgi:hypothetical protein
VFWSRIRYPVAPTDGDFTLSGLSSRFPIPKKITTRVGRHNSFRFSGVGAIVLEFLDQGLKFFGSFARNGSALEFSLP